MPQPPDPFPGGSHSVLVKRNPFTPPVKLGRRPVDARHRLARLSQTERIDQLLEFQNAYAVVRAGLPGECGEDCKKVEQKITNSQST